LRQRRGPASAGDAAPRTNPGSGAGRRQPRRLRAAAAGAFGVRRAAGGGGMTTALTLQSVQQQCKQLRLPAIAGQCGPLASAAERERQPYLGYLEALLAAELEEREHRAISRRIHEAHFPRLKTLDDFDFQQAPQISATQLAELSGGGYIERAEPVVFI